MCVGRERQQREWTVVGMAVHRDNDEERHERVEDLLRRLRPQNDPPANALPKPDLNKAERTENDRAKKSERG